jgi:hypothetical protein
VAAGVVVAILLRRDREPVIEVEKPLETVQPRMANAFDDAMPSVWTYRRVLSRSADELTALLDKHAGLTREPNAQFVQVRAFTRFDTDPHPLPGEL